MMFIDLSGVARKLRGGSSLELSKVPSRKPKTRFRKRDVLTKWRNSSGTWHVTARGRSSPKRYATLPKPRQR